MAQVTLFILVLLVELIRARKNSFNVNQFQATQLINHSNAIVIDIRPNDLFRKGHIIDAQSMTAQEIRNHAKKLEKWKNKPIIIFCKHRYRVAKSSRVIVKTRL